MHALPERDILADGRMTEAARRLISLQRRVLGLHEGVELGSPALYAGKACLAPIWATG
jgi:hypothetical protein